MSRKLADSTIEKLREDLTAERSRILDTVEAHRQQLEQSLESEAASERIPDPSTGEGGTLAFEYEMERQLDATNLLHVQQIEHALERGGQRPGDGFLIETPGLVQALAHEYADIGQAGEPHMPFGDVDRFEQIGIFEQRGEAGAGPGTQVTV